MGADRHYRGTYRVLGPVEADGPRGRPAAPGSPRQRLLLAVLLARAGEMVTADCLADCLWGNDQPADPRAALWSQVSRLRNRLGDSAPIETGPLGYRFTAPELVDADAFRLLLAEGQGLRAAGDTAGALDRFQAALALWRGRAFGDAADHPALAAAAARLEDQRVEAAEGRAAALITLGRAAEAVDVVAALCHDHPFRERPVELRMQALAASGRFVEALRSFEDFRRTLAEELGLDPSPELRRIEAEILRHELRPPGKIPASPTVIRPPTLAPPPDRFVGRAAEADTLSARLERARLVTVTGPGGVGKTRLTTHVVEAVAGRYADGVWCCALATVPADGDVSSAVASALRVEQQKGVSPEDRIVEFLAPKQALLVLDNCEHVLDGAAALVQAVVAGTGRIDVLTTSREPLGVAGEHRMLLGPLPVPVEADADAPALVLFAERAAATTPGFRLDGENLTAACELCRRVDGLPLAIELAAARIAARTVPEIAEEIADRLGAISGGRGRAERHRSIHALVDWSYDLLDEGDRVPFEELAVFAGGWTADAAATVSGAEIGLVVDRLARLVDRSLVTAQTETATTRYGMLEPIRAYAEDRLRRRSRLDEARDRHSRFFVAYAEETDRHLRGVGSESGGRWFDQEVPNLRLAHRWAVNRGDADGALRLAGALYWYGYEGGPSEVLAWAEEAVALFATADHPCLPAACATAAVGAWKRGDLARARRLAHQGIAAAGDDPSSARLAYEAVGDIENFAGNFDAAFLHFRRAAELSRRAGDDYQLTADLGNCALSRAYGGHGDESRRWADEALAVATRAGHPGMLAWANYFAGEVRLDDDPAEAGAYLERSLAGAGGLASGGQFLRGVAGLSAVSVQTRTGDAAAALRRYPDLIEHWHRSGVWNQQWTTMRTLIEALSRAGHPSPAAVLHGALCASARATPLAGADANRMGAVVNRLRGELGEDVFAALTAQGAGLGDAGAVSYAVDTLRALASS